MSSDPIQNGAAPEEAQRRNRAIKRAVVTSLASKVGTALLQLVAIPIAYRVLGGEDFGLFATASMGIGMVILLQIGIGPALTHGLSRAVAGGDRATEKAYHSTSLFLMAAMAVFGVAVFGLILLFVPITVMFGEHYAGSEAKMMPVLWLSLGIVLLEMVLSHTERSREGYLEMSVNNAWGAAGNFLGGIGLAVGIFHFPSIEFLIIAVYGSHVLAKACNTVHFFVRRPELLPRLGNWRKDVFKDLMGDGLAFSVSHTLAPVIALNGCGLIVAHIAGPETVGVFHILMQLVTFMFGFVMMFTTPTWPSVVDAYARHDLDWVRMAAGRLSKFILFYSLAAVVGLTFFGSTAMHLWMGPDFAVDWILMLPFGLFFAAKAWGHTIHSMLIGVGLVKQSAIYVLLESCVLLVPVYFGMTLFGLAGVFGGMALTLFGITGWIFPLMFYKRLRGTQDTRSQSLVGIEVHG